MMIPHPDCQLLSIITATYNAAPFLQQCLDSVSSQALGGMLIEHIVVDGASTDGTVDILKNHPSVQWISEPDKGQSDAFNKGVTMAKGDWICWLNADDKLAAGAITSFQKALKIHPRADVIYGHVQFIDENNQLIKTSYQLPFFYTLLLNGCYNPPSVGTFFRRELFQQNPLDVDYHYVMDVEWFLRNGRNLRMHCVDQVYAHFRVSADAKTSEMIRTGKITEQHDFERENYRRRYIYSQWPSLTESQARERFRKRQKFYLWIYKTLKLRYAWRYWQERVAKSSK